MKAPRPTRNLQNTQPHPAKYNGQFNIHREMNTLFFGRASPKEDASWVKEEDITEAAVK